MTTTKVAVLAEDYLSAKGAFHLLRSSPELTPLRSAELDQADVVLVVTAEVTERTFEELHRVCSMSHPQDLRMVLVTDHVDGEHLTRLVRLGLRALVPRLEADAERILHAIRKSQGRADIAVHGLPGRPQRSHREPSQSDGLGAREILVLKLLSEGMDTPEIARMLECSESTIKKIIHDIFVRTGVRNRTHAVAHALRLGVI